VWDAVLDWPGRPPTASFSVDSQPAVCANCGLVGELWSMLSGEGFSRQLVQSEVYVRVEPGDLRLEAFDDEAIRVTHLPTRIVAEARAYQTTRDNYRAALQTLALQLRAREETTDTT
jgi:hypothetical protein